MSNLLLITKRYFCSKKYVRAEFECTQKKLKYRILLTMLQSHSSNQVNLSNYKLYRLLLRFDLEFRADNKSELKYACGNFLTVICCNDSFPFHVPLILQ